MQCGAVDNRRKETYRGKALTSYAIGSPPLMKWLDCNPMVEFQRIDKVFNPATIGRNPKFVTVIPALRIDLKGRVSLQTGWENLMTSPSEVMDFFSGAELSQGGRTLFALPSRDSAAQANIVLSVAHDPNQFSLFESVHTVVTEYGVAYLEGRTVRERAQMLIDIAHPDDRSRLVEQAKAAKILYADQIYLSESARLYPAEISEEKALKNGVRVYFRAIKPSDEEQMRRLFYRFSYDSIYSRYFHSVTAMPHAKMQAYVNVDWNQVMSIIGTVEERGERRLIAEGRYIRIPGTPTAEVVFVVDEKYQSVGIGTHLYIMLVRLARERGIRTFLADVLFSNSAMMKVFRKGNLPIKAYLEGGVYHLEISLT
jgi:GNAT superfamily N-acetyltransferase